MILTMSIFLLTVYEIASKNFPDVACKVHWLATILIVIVLYKI